MSEITANVNWLAVGVGTLVAWVFGGLWYSPKMLGKKWAEGVGLSQEAAQSQPAKAMATQLLGTFLLAWVVAVTAANDALLTIILVGVTIATLLAAGGMFSRKSSYAIAAEAGYVIVMVVIMILVHAAI